MSEPTDVSRSTGRIVPEGSVTSRTLSVAGVASADGPDAGAGDAAGTTPAVATGLASVAWAVFPTPAACEHAARSVIEAMRTIARFMLLFLQRLDCATPLPR